MMAKKHMGDTVELDCSDEDYQHEIQSWPALASDRDLLMKCQKNPGHSDFIPLSSLDPTSFPKKCQNPKLLNYIKAMGVFVVRVRAPFTSKKRPDSKLYPKGPRMASGFIRMPGRLTHSSCLLPECSYGEEGHTVYGPITIVTTKHVVYDEEEAKHVEADLFYELGHSRVHTLRCLGIDRRDDSSEEVHLSFVTHDSDISHTLQKSAREASDIYTKIPRSLWHHCANLCVVIAHPHGTMKCITLGYLSHSSSANSKPYSTTFHYTSATCPGSSGGLVLCVKNGQENFPMWLPAVHCYFCPTMQLSCGSL